MGSTGERYRLDKLETAIGPRRDVELLVRVAVVGEALDLGQSAGPHPPPHSVCSAS